MKKIAAIWFFLVSIISSYGQQLNITNYTKESGLSQSHVESIFEDSRGYLWVGTESSGLNVFDGFDFTYYSVSEGLHDNKIRAICEDDRGVMWIGTKSGFVDKFDGTQFTPFSFVKAGEENEITCLAKDLAGFIWVGTKRGDLYKIVHDQISLVKYADAEQVSPIKILFVASNGDLWIGTKRFGVFVLKKNSSENISALEGLCNNTVNDISEDANGLIWIATRYGVSLYNGFKFRNFYHTSGLSSSYITSICCDKRGSVWFGSYGYGVTKFDGTNFSYYTTKNGLSNDFVSDILTDRSGNVWVSSNGGGVSKLGGEQFVFYNTDHGLSNNTVLSMLQDSDSSIWFGTYGSGLCRFKDDKFYYLTTADGLCSDLIYTIYKDSEKNLWFSSKDHGVSCYNGKEFTNFSIRNGLSSNMISSVIEDRFNNYWFGSNGKGIDLWNGKKFVNIGKKNGLSSDYVNVIFEDSYGNIWIGTDEAGVEMIFHELSSDEIINDGKINEFRHINITQDYGLNNNRVVSILEDKKKNIWLGTIGGGISKFDGKRITTFTVSEGLSSNDIHLILFDKRGYLWVGTTKGINLIKFDDQTENTIIKTYGVEDGFSSMVNLNINTALEDFNGAIWFSSDKGVAKYTPEKDLPNKIPPKIHLRAVKLFSAETNWSKYADSLTHWGHFPVLPELAFNKNHLDFEFLATDLRNPQKVEYQWKLDGFDEDWSEPTRSRSVIYSYLPPGQYTFRVRAMNSDGYINDVPAKIGFSIVPPIWASWKFYTILTLVIATILVIMIKSRQQKLLKEKEVLEKRVVERTRLLQEEKIVVEMQKNELDRHRVDLEKSNLELTKLSIVASKTSNSVVIFNNDLTIEWVNTGFCKMYENPFDKLAEYYGKTILEASNNNKIKEAVDECVNTKESVDYITRVETIKGTHKWIQTTLTPALNDKNEIEKFIAVEVDITSIKDAEEEIQRQKTELEKEKEISDSLLLNILPEETATELKLNGKSPPRYYRNVSVMFTDIQNFTSSCENLTPSQLVTELHYYFEKFDSITDKYFIEKIKTIGDAYMCVGGVPIRNRTHTFDTVLAGLEMQRLAEDFKKDKRSETVPVWEIRLGIHTGDVVAGVVGKRKFAYDIWGDTVNIASRMESHGEVGKVNVSETTYHMIKDYFVTEHRGKIDVKSKGMIDMYFVHGIKPGFSENGEGILPNEVFRDFLAQL